jgi:hypothetical protein
MAHGKDDPSQDWIPGIPEAGKIDSYRLPALLAWTSPTSEGGVWAGEGGTESLIKVKKARSGTTSRNLLVYLVQFHLEFSN